jgi:hypothetical protein
MLMKEKGFFIFGVTMVLLALGLLLAGCGEGNPETEGGNVSILLSLPSPSPDGRTTGAVMPDLADILSKVEVVYDGPVNNEEDPEVFDVVDGEIGPMELRLPRGTYEFTVTGYGKGKYENVPIATSKSTKTATADGTVNVFIGPIPQESEQSYFKWDILPGVSDFIFVKVTIDSLNDFQKTETSNAKSSIYGIPLSSGSYAMKAEVKDMNETPRSYETVVHIYPAEGIYITMTLGADCFTAGETGNTSVNLYDNALRQIGDVLTANDAFDEVTWYINGEVTADGVDDTGRVFTWTNVDVSDYDVGPHYVRFLGKADGVWLSRTVRFEREQPESAVYYLNSAVTNENMDGTTPAKAFKTLEKAVAAPVLGESKTIKIIGEYKISDGVKTFDATDAETLPTITLEENETGTDGSLITVEGGAQVTFKGITFNGIVDAGTLYRRGLLVTGAESSVTLDAGTTVTGKAYRNGGGVSVENGATLTMKDDSTVTGSIGPDFGGGVYITGSGSTFIMNGGMISNNRTQGSGNGGGVSIISEGRFTMITGTISGNQAMNGGGVYIGSGGTFTMDDGTISGNTASSDGGGVYASGAFSMTAGTVYGSTGTYKNTVTSGRLGASLYLGSGGSASVKSVVMALSRDDNLE